MVRKTRKFVVYWLFTDRDVCPWRHGYIGVSGRFARRMHQHREGKHFRVKGVKWRVLFEGQKDECLMLETKLRPTPGIGWNKGPGGSLDGTTIRGLPKSPEQREKMRAAALKRYADPTERERTSRAVKEAFANGDFRRKRDDGYRHSEETKRKISEAKRRQRYCRHEAV